MQLSTINRWGFKQQLVLTFSVGIVCLALISSLAISAFSSRSLQAQLIAQGLKVTDSFARQSALALLYQSPENARDAALTTLDFPDVLAVSIYDLEHRPLIAQGEVSDFFSVPPTGRLPGLQLERDTDHAWYFIAPVFSQHSSDDSPFAASVVVPELIGYVRVVMGKSSLNRVVSDALRGNLLISMALAIVLLSVLLEITSRMTRPLNQLAKTMRRAQQGEQGVRADVEGPQDIKHMEMAFNTMMTVLEAREEELLAARDSALESARLKGEFATNVSHDLRTPLNGVLGMLELLNNMGLTPKQREYVEVALGSGRSLLALVEDILDFSRIEAGRLKSHNEDFDLREVQRDVIGLVVGQAQRKGLEIGYLVDPQLPAIFCGDAGRLRQILLNLLGNAIKFTEHGEVMLSVSVVSKLNQVGSWNLRFEVKDSGIGIAADAQRRIFEPFSQADGSTTRRYGGTGLGLAICRQLVGLLGGEIGVESEEGVGSLFWFTLPMEEAEFQGESGPPSHDFTGYRALIVDDSTISCKFLQQTLSGWGMHCVVAESALQALQLLAEATERGEEFRFAIIDHELASVEGVSFSHRLKEEPTLQQIAVIIMIKRWQLGFETLQLGDASGYVEKPVEESALFDAIVNVLKPTLPAVAERRSGERPKLEAQLGKHVLVAEDNRANQQVALGMLEYLGCEVTLAADGREALQWLEERSFDVVLMDCHMPEMDGYQATQQMRADKRWEKLPIIAMTANVGDEVMRRCQEVGMDDYLAKPLNLELLKNLLLAWTSEQRGSSAAWSEIESDEPELSPGRYPLDREVLGELRESIGDSFSMLLAVFLEDMPVYLETLEKAILENNSPAASNIAHGIKGSARNIGANQLAIYAKLLEEIGHSDNLAGAGEVLKSLAREYDEVKLELQHIADSQGAASEVSDLQQKPSSSILIVDDDRGIRFALRTVLMRDGYRIKEAGNGEQAVSICERQMPDLVLMDALMPVMDGFTACTKMRDLPGGNHMPVLIITALDDEGSIEKAFSAGATDYVPKPVHFAVLRQRVARLLHASLAEKHVHKLAYHDTLTGLPNRALFMERIRELVESDIQVKRTFAVLFLDLDRFKLVNDTLGHDIGDLLLQAVSERITRCVRAGDLVARLGGDEFTIILDNIHAIESVVTVAEKICAVVAEPFMFMQQEIYVSTSIGISMYPDDGTDIGALLKHADTAMFRAKEQGNGFQFYEFGMGAEVSQRVSLENDLRRALERREFVVHYQPQKRLSSDEVISAEALIRWQHPSRGLVSPADFIPLAEENGLIIPMGDWVMESVCQQMRVWLDAGLPPVRVAVNLSAKQLDEGVLVSKVERVLASSRLPAELLELEITESATMKQPENVIHTLTQLKRMGVRLAIDDFGIGYSSLNYLKRFPIDCLKVDRVFVQDITKDREDAEIISGIVALAHGLGLKVTAEGVETHEQESFLRRCNCDLVQGFYCSPPISATEFANSYLLPKVPISSDQH